MERCAVEREKAAKTLLVNQQALVVAHVTRLEVDVSYTARVVNRARQHSAIGARGYVDREPFVQVVRCLEMKARYVVALAVVVVVAH